MGTAALQGIISNTHDLLYITTLVQVVAAFTKWGWCERTGLGKGASWPLEHAGPMPCCLFKAGKQPPRIVCYCISGCTGCQSLGEGGCQLGRHMEIRVGPQDGPMHLRVVWLWGQRVLHS
jgi:hypothetical protein